MRPAIQIVLNKRNKDVTWNAHAKHPVKVHFEMEIVGKQDWWNTLRAMQVLKRFGHVPNGKK